MDSLDWRHYLIFENIFVKMKCVCVCAVMCACVLLVRKQMDKLYFNMIAAKYFISNPPTTNCVTPNFWRRPNSFCSSRSLGISISSKALTYLLQLNAQHLWISESNIGSYGNRLFEMAHNGKQWNNKKQKIYVNLSDKIEFAL